MSEDLNSTCDLLLVSIRDSGLNFSARRKSFIKPRNIKTGDLSANENLSTENELNLPKVECEKLVECINSFMRQGKVILRI
jgi:hypothetical protein